MCVSTSGSRPVDGIVAVHAECLHGERGLMNVTSWFVIGSNGVDDSDTTDKNDTSRRDPTADRRDSAQPEIVAAGLDHRPIAEA